MTVRGCISCVTDCPYEGSGTPEQVAKMLDKVLNELPKDRLAGHFHDTNGRALENIAVSLEKGIRVFDSSIGGLGGCPYAPGATGNVASESVAQMVEKMGYETGLDLEKLSQVVTLVQTIVKTNG